MNLVKAVASHPSLKYFVLYAQSWDYSSCADTVRELLSENYTLQKIHLLELSVGDYDNFEWLENRNKFLAKQQRFKTVKLAAH